MRVGTTLDSMAIDSSATRERLTQIDNIIERYRAVKQQRLLRLAMRLWRRAEAQQWLVTLEAPIERVH